MSSDPLVIDGNSLTIQEVYSVAVQGRPVAVAEKTWEAVERSRRVVDTLVERGEVAYGITTGFGEFAHVTIARDQVRALQRNLLMSHAVGVGPSLTKESVRAMLLLRINTLLKGLSGVRRCLIERLLEFVNRGVIPVVPSRGSVGASGDLAPLAHMSLPLIGLGKVDLQGETMDAAAALQRLGLAPLTLEAKEGLALINGTQLMSALGALGVHEATTLLQDAQIVAGMSLEALMGSVRPFEARIQAVRPHPGQGIIASNLRKLTAASEIVASHAGCGRIQDAYSLRCIPQVLGACWDAIDYTHRVVEIELNSATDNPLIFPDGDIISQGNFHGENLALVLDSLAMALAEIANIAERRIERLVNPALSEGLKPFLVAAGGLNSGFMIAQYVAAALVSENKIYAHPASVDSIPTSANQEDHVSMGSISALKLTPILENVRYVVALEALCAAQALDFKQPLRAGQGSQAAHDRIRQTVPTLDHDRILADDVESLTRLLKSGALRTAVAAAGIHIK